MKGFPNFLIISINPSKTYFMRTPRNNGWQIFILRWWRKTVLRSLLLIKHLMIRRNITLRHKDVRQGKYFDHYKRCIPYTFKIYKFSSFEAISLNISFISLRPLLDYIFFFDYEICIQVLQRLEINACVHS